MTTYPAPVCIECRHFHGADASQVPRCDAFPERIPDRIWFRSDPHTGPIPGDGGIRFEPIPKQDSQIHFACDPDFYIIGLSYEDRDRYEGDLHVKCPGWVSTDVRCACKCHEATSMGPPRSR